MLKKFLKYVEEYCRIVTGQKILLAVSGGIDSMVMADLFVKSGFSAGFAHCNFGLRGVESDRDAAFVKDMAEKYNCQIYIKTLDATGYSYSKKVSIQMAARDMRYDWFEELIQNTDYNFYATAHHFEDQVETFFINLLRGTGIAGLTGIAPVKGHCIRPLLFAERKMIEEYAKKHDILFREDSSNLKNDYLRNRIRHFVLPELEKTDAHFKSGMENTFRALAEAGDFITNEISEKRGSVCTLKDGGLIINIQKLKQEKHPGFVLFQILKPLGFNHSTVSDIIQSLDSEPGKRFLSRSHELVIDRNMLIVSDAVDETGETVKISQSVKEIFSPVHLLMEILEYQDQEIPKSPDIAWLDYDKLSFPLEIRNYQPGDAFVPLGMKGRKKLSDFMIDLKIPLPEKRNIRLLTSNDEIAWVIGYRIDDRFKVTQNTSRILMLHLI